MSECDVSSSHALMPLQLILLPDAKNPDLPLWSASFTQTVQVHGHCCMLLTFVDSLCKQVQMGQQVPPLSFCSKS